MIKIMIDNYYHQYLPVHARIVLLSQNFNEMKTNEIQNVEIPEEEFDRNFKPKGAIAFFVLLVILGAVIWYGIYFLMLSRA